ncbi:MAG TPA: hypothetical protein VGN26_04090 [Armatimonadota bacterium]|jgi:hypothetical protein
MPDTLTLQAGERTLTLAGDEAHALIERYFPAEESAPAPEPIDPRRAAEEEAQEALRTLWADTPDYLRLCWGVERVQDLTERGLRELLARIPSRRAWLSHGRRR